MKSRRKNFAWAAVAAALLLIPTQAPAQGYTFGGSKTALTTLQKTALAYAASISCMDKAAVRIIELVPAAKGRDKAAYLAMWSGDVGCNGGSGTDSMNFALLRIAAGNRVFVDVSESTPVASFPSPVRFVEKVVSNTASSVTLQGLDYAEDDPMCCPTLLTQFTLARVSKGKWTVKGKHVLGRKKK